MTTSVNPRSFTEINKVMGQCLFHIENITKKVTTHYNTNNNNSVGNSSFSANSNSNSDNLLANYKEKLLTLTENCLEFRKELEKTEQIINSDSLSALIDEDEQKSIGNLKRKIAESVGKYKTKSDPEYNQIASIFSPKKSKKSKKNQDSDDELEIIESEMSIHDTICPYSRALIKQAMKK